MRNTILMLSATLLIGATAVAQKDSSGIYNTADDYKNHRLTYPINYKMDRHKIKDYLFFEPTHVKVKHGDETFRLEKSSIYGYRNTKGVDYRFVGERSYRILNPGEPIILYKYGEPQTDPIKNPPVQMNRYYFSTDASLSPLNLTRANLKKAFPDNLKFHQAIDRTFRSDDELDRFDRVRNRYTVNVLLEESMKE